MENIAFFCGCAALSAQNNFLLKVSLNHQMSHRHHHHLFSLKKKEREKDMNHKQKNKEEEEEEEDKEINKLLLSLMEGYNDAVIPPLSDLSPLHEAAGTDTVAIDNKSSRKRCRDGEYKEQVPEIVKNERERRNKMKENFMVLQTMLPNILPKASRERIIHETISHIEFLKEEIERLEEKKNSSSASTSSSSTSPSMVAKRYSNWNSSINVTVYGNVVFFGIQTLARQRLVTEIFKVFHKNGAEVMAGNVAVNHGQLTLTVTAFINGNKDHIVEKIKRDILVL